MSIRIPAPLALWTAAAIVALVPVKYLTVRVGGADVTAFRVALLAGALVAAGAVLTDVRARAALVAALRTRTALAAASFAVWAVAAGGYGFAAAPNAAFERRAVLGTVGWLIPVVLLPLVLLPLLGRLERPWRPGVIAVRVSQALLVFAFVQVLLHLIGVPVNGISAAEERIYPVASVLGLELLRPYSLFGEPRDLAALLIPLMLAGALVAGRRRLGLGAGLVVGAFGILIASFTFFAALAAFGLYYLVFERRTGIVPSSTAAVAVALMLSVPLLAPAVGSESRVADEITELVKEDPAEEEPEDEEPVGVGTAAFNQAPDLLADDYLRRAATGGIGVRQLLVGSGVGSFTRSVNPFYVERFRYDLVERETFVNSRLLPFGLLVELGVVGIALFGWLLAEALRALHRSGLGHATTAQLRVLCVALVLASVVQTSILFALAVLVCLVAYTYPRPPVASTNPS